MSLLRVRALALFVLLVAGALLLVDLFLTWQDASVRVTGVHVDAGVSGWSGWGILAGMLLIALLAWAAIQFVRPQADDEDHPGRSLAIAGLGVAVLGTVIGRFEDTAKTAVDVPMAMVRVGARNWPAWTGLGLAVIVAVAAAVPFVVEGWRRTTGRARHVPRPLT
jgi:hypothetical protein